MDILYCIKLKNSDHRHWTVRDYDSEVEEEARRLFPNTSDIVIERYDENSDGTPKDIIRKWVI